MLRVPKDRGTGANYVTNMCHVKALNVKILSILYLEEEHGETSSGNDSSRGTSHLSSLEMVSGC